MNLLTLLPKGLKVQLLLQGLNWAVKELEAVHVGQLLNDAMDRKVGKVTSDPIQERLAAWLRLVAEELEKP